MPAPITMFPETAFVFVRDTVLEPTFVNTLEVVRTPLKVMLAFEPPIDVSVSKKIACLTSHIRLYALTKV